MKPLPTARPNIGLNGRDVYTQFSASTTCTNGNMICICTAPRIAKPIRSDGRGMSENKIRCPQCGSENEPGDHFCSDCGSRLLKAKSPSLPEPEASTPEPTAAPPPPVRTSTGSFPPPVTPSFIENPPPLAGATDNDGEWRMSSLGPPPKPKRRLWLWIVIGILAACLIVCVAAVIFFNTGTGQHWVNDIGTQVSNEATKQAK